MKRNASIGMYYLYTFLVAVAVAILTSCNKEQIKVTAVIEPQETTEEQIYYTIKQSNGKVFEYCTEREVNHYINTGEFKYLP